MVDEQWSPEIVKSVIVPYLNGLLGRSGWSDGVQICYYDAHVPIVHTESANSGSFSIVVGRVEIKRNNEKVIDDSYRILRQLDFSTDGTALDTLWRLIDKFMLLQRSSVDGGEVWFTDYTSMSTIVSTYTIVTPAKIC
jgi:hypothetical protein